MGPSPQQARDIIYQQENVSLAIKESAWFLFRHELSKPQPPTPRRALQRVLHWMAGQRVRHMTVHLTPRELQIMKMLVEGLTLKQISVEVGISFRTVARHMQRVRRKTGTVSMYQVIAVAVDQGWVQA